MQDLVWIASFDIGKKNFAFCIEETNRSELTKLNEKLPDKKNRYNPDGTPTILMKEILDEVCHNGKIIFFKNSDLTMNCDSVYLDPETFHNMIDLLDTYREYWDKCIAFVIEEQMNFKGKRNPMAMRLGQHCYSYFCFLYGRHRQVINFPSYHKTHVLGAIKTKSQKGRYKTMSKTDRKKWTVETAKRFLKERGDEQDILNNKGKKDDLADTWCQLQAMKFLTFVDHSY